MNHACPNHATFKEVASDGEWTTFAAVLCNDMTPRGRLCDEGTFTYANFKPDWTCAACVRGDPIRL